MTIRNPDSVLLLFFFVLASPAQTLNPKPVKALGAPRLIATQANPGALDSVNPNFVEAKDLFEPTAVVLDYSSTPPSVYIADTSNNRVLGWKYSSQLANGAPADIVVGQSSFYSTMQQGPNGVGLSIGLNTPTGLAVDKSGNLYVADTGNNRILRFPSPFLQNNVLKSPDLVLGQSGFSGFAPNFQGVTATGLYLNTQQTFPPHIGLALDTAGNLFVTDFGNHRVLRYPAGALSGGAGGAVAADLVLGQTQFSTNTSASGNRASKSALTAPVGLAFDSVGRLFVADSLGRVLVYAKGFFTGTAATRILGVAVKIPNQPAPAAVSEVNVGFVMSVAIGPGDHPIVVDSGYNRVLIYDSFDKWPPETPSIISPSALTVIGQSTFSLRGGNQGGRFATSSGLVSPFDAAASANELYIVDTGNNRVLNFPLPTTTEVSVATRVLGQISFIFSSPNFVEGREFSLSGDGATGSIVIDRNSTPPHLYVADTANNRILGFQDFNRARAGQFADLVIGQQNLLSTAFNNSTNDPTVPNSAGLSHPTQLALDATGNLFVADSGNSRVLRFSQPFAQSARINQSADLVIGQASFTSSVTSATNRTMQSPAGVAVLSDGSLLVSDATLNRVLYFQQPLISGMPASKVLGQLDFNSPNNSAPVQTSVFDPLRFNGPRQIAVDPQDRLYVCDTGNHRIAIFDTIGNVNPTLAAPVYSLSAGLNQPIGISIGAANTSVAGQLWVADVGANAAYHYGQFIQLLKNDGTADVSVAAFHPLSAAFDSFGNLALADVANRVLLFVPQLAILNSASFASGPVAPGTIISVFSAAAPLGSTKATLATTTANFNDLPTPLPLPTDLGDVQVLVNGAPAPLFYVSPSQINLPLPSTLPTSGTVDLEIVSKSSARIFGLTELSLSAVSPGLFTLAGIGFGQLAALNSPDSSVNTASAPLVRGQYLTLFGTGQGPVPSAPPDGSVAQGQTLTTDQPRVVIGNVDAPNVTYSGLAPGLIGVWQINVQVPQDVTAGNTVTVVVYLRGVASQSGTFTTYVALR